MSCACPLCAGTGVSVVWDSMMTGLGCCGVTNYTDFAGILQPSEQLVSIRHRRRIYTEEMAKVVAAAWGTELFPFLEALTILHQDDWKNTYIKIILFFHSSWCKSSYSSNCPGAKYLALKGMEAILFPKQQRRPLLWLSTLFCSPFVLISKRTKSLKPGSEFS